MTATESRRSTEMTTEQPKPAAGTSKPQATIRASEMKPVGSATGYVDGGWCLFGWEEC